MIDTIGQANPYEIIAWGAIILIALVTITVTVSLLKELEQMIFKKHDKNEPTNKP